jgi:hypothetical protein
MLGLQLFLASIGFTFAKGLFSLRKMVVYIRNCAATCWNLFLRLLYPHENELPDNCLHVGCVLPDSFCPRYGNDRIFNVQKSKV